MKVLVCGGRDFSDYLAFARAMNAIRDERGPFTEIIHGGAKGADWCAHLYAGLPNQGMERCFPADWKRDGRGAGPIRNQRMLDEGKPDLVVAFPGGRGTADMIRRSRKAGIEVIEPMAALSGAGGCCTAGGMEIPRDRDVPSGLRASSRSS